jgi:hypothetical protein
MTLTDPCDALAEQSSFIGYLTGLASVSRMVHALADHDRQTGPLGDADDLVSVLLGLASLGDTIQRLISPVATQPSPTDRAVTTARSTTRWLR